MVKWADQHEKGKAAEILVIKAMSSDKSKNDDNGNSRVMKYAVKRLSWENRQLRKMRKKLDKPYMNRPTTRAK